MKKILFFGDSNTYGFDPAGPIGGRYPEAQRWTNILMRSLGAEWTLEADGLNGRMIPDSPYMQGMLWDSVLRHEPDVLVIMLGSNDILSSRAEEPEDILTEISGKIESLMQYLAIQKKRAGLDFQIMLCVPPKMHTGVMRFDRTSGELPAVYRESAHRFAAHFIDASSWQVELTGDGVHFSEQGHKAFAVRMAQELKNHTL